MIVIICAKYKKNPSRTVDATEQTRFSKSRPNDLKDIGQGQGSSHATHPLMLLIIYTKYGKYPSWTVDATGRTWKVNRHLREKHKCIVMRIDDGQTDSQTDRVNPIYPPNFIAECIITIFTQWNLVRSSVHVTSVPSVIVAIILPHKYGRQNTNSLHC